MPYLGTTAAIAGLLAGLMLGMIGTWVIARSLWPQWLARAEERWQQTPGRTLAAGVPVTLAMFLLNAALIGTGDPRIGIIGFVTLGSSIGFVLVGMAALATRIGRGLASPKDAGREWVQTLKGGVPLTLAFLTPALGQLLLAAAVIGGAGAAGLALLKRKPEREEARASNRAIGSMLAPPAAATVVTASPATESEA